MLRSRNNEYISIILAAGRSTRMGSPETAKVCFPIAGRPAILRALDVYHEAGIERHVVVVGHQAEQVMRTVTDGYSGDVSYAFQSQLLGTGHAARCGARLLQRLGYRGNVLVVVGDKAIRASAVQRLMKTFQERRADLAFIVAERDVEPDAGRVILSTKDEPIANVEKFDSGRSRLLALYFTETDGGSELDGPRALSLAREFIGADAKVARALGELYTRLKNGERLDRELLQHYFSPDDRFIDIGNGRKITGADVEKSRYVNLSVYLFRAQALYTAVTQFSTNNAQQEEYLTDAIAILAAAQKYRIVAVPVQDSTEVLGFNTRDELHHIERVYGGTPVVLEPERDTSSGRSVRQWLELLDQPDAGLRRWHSSTYGDQADNFNEKLNALKHCCLRFFQRFGDGELLLVRAPGRANVLGRHIDHQGGVCHTMAIDREIFLLARLRRDRLLRLCHADAEKYPDREFDLGPLDASIKAKSWQASLAALPGPPLLPPRDDWAAYLLGALLRLQQAAGHPFAGLDILVGGTLSEAAGLSSSSALVVATAEALCHLNKLPLSREALVTLCAEAEWFVGTRGGAADHAAILLGECGKIRPLHFFPATYARTIDWPEELRLLIAGSGVAAKKSGEARTLYNQKVACYHLALAALQQLHPNSFANVRYIRDVDPDFLQLELSGFYRLLADVPVHLQGKEARERFGINWEKLMPGDAAADQHLFPIRDVFLYGIAECARSRRFHQALLRRDLALAGQLMNISHNGDRIAYLDGEQQRPHRLHYTDVHLDTLAKVARHHPEDAALYRQPGAYRCSIAEIDRMVDIATSVSGVLGAQLAGAGLGGSMMALVREQAVEACQNALDAGYYEPRQQDGLMQVSLPVQGSGVVTLE